VEVLVAVAAAGAAAVVDVDNARKETRANHGKNNAYSIDDDLAPNHAKHGAKDSAKNNAKLGDWPGDRCRAASRRSRSQYLRDTDGRDSSDD
jgi:hypothetical protein